MYRYFYAYIGVAQAINKKSRNSIFDNNEERLFESLGTMISEQLRQSMEYSDSLIHEFKLKKILAVR